MSYSFKDYDDIYGKVGKVLNTHTSLATVTITIYMKNIEKP